MIWLYHFSSYFLRCGWCSVVSNRSLSLKTGSLWYNGDLGAYTWKWNPLVWCWSCLAFISTPHSWSELFKEAYLELSLCFLNAKSCDFERAGVQFTQIFHWAYRSLFQRWFLRLCICFGVAALSSYFNLIPSFHTVEGLYLQSVPSSPSCSSQLLRWEHYWPRLLKLVSVAGMSTQRRLWGLLADRLGK